MPHARNQCLDINHTPTLGLSDTRRHVYFGRDGTHFRKSGWLASTSKSTARYYSIIHESEARTMTDQPVLSQWEKITTLLAQARVTTDTDSQDLASSIYSMISELEAEHRDLLEEANLSLHQLQNVQALLEKQTLSQQATCEENEKLQTELAVVKEDNESLKGHLAAVYEDNDSLKGTLAAVYDDNDSLKGKLAVFNDDKVRLKAELKDVREDTQLLLKQLHQAQEELERHFLEANNLRGQVTRQTDKLCWLREQRELLIDMVREQGRALRAFMALNSRFAGLK